MRGEIVEYYFCRTLFMTTNKHYLVYKRSLGFGEVSIHYLNTWNVCYLNHNCSVLQIVRYSNHNCFVQQIVCYSNHNCFVQQIAISDHERNSRVNPLLKVAGKGLKSAKETASKTVRIIILRNCIKNRKIYHLTSKAQLRWGSKLLVKLLA